VIARGEVRRQHLRQISPLRDEDDRERGRHHPVRARQCHFDHVFGRLLFLPRRLGERQHGTDREQHRDEHVDRTVGKQMEQRDPDAHRDDHVHHEGERRADPHGERAPPRREQQRCEHRLVRQLAEEDQREDRENDSDVHGR